MSQQHILVGSWVHGEFRIPNNDRMTSILFYFRFADGSERLLCLPPRQWFLLLDSLEMYCKERPNLDPEKHPDRVAIFDRWNRFCPEPTQSQMRPGQSNIALNLHFIAHPDCVHLHVQHMEGPPGEFLILGHLAYYLLAMMMNIGADCDLKRPPSSIQ